jgi:N-acetyltransferase 10
MLYLCTSKILYFHDSTPLNSITNHVTNRYEIGAGAADWDEAERVVSNAAKKGGAGSMTVAVKTGEKKRKVGEAVEEAYKEAEKFKEGAAKKSKKHKSSKKA